MEAYCEIGSNGLKVCARKRGGGKCDPFHGNTPFSSKPHDREPSSPDQVSSAVAQPEDQPVHDLVLVVGSHGKVRVKLRRETSPLAVQFIHSLLAQSPQCTGCSFYRAEAVPATWGSVELPDSHNPGRWGPPYALLQGGLRADGVAMPAESTAREDAPVIQRGMVAWAGGGSGPDFFVALAEHPEWGRGHTVWGDVVEADMVVLERLLALPTKVRPGNPPVTNLVTPVPLSVTGMKAA